MKNLCDFAPVIPIGDELGERYRPGPHEPLDVDGKPTVFGLIAFTAEPPKQGERFQFQICRHCGSVYATEFTQ